VKRIFKSAVRVQFGHLIGQRRDAPAEQLDADLLPAHLGIIQFQTNVIQHFVGQCGRKDGSRPLDLNGDRR
jgi:hypothetical protein